MFYQVLNGDMIFATMLIGPGWQLVPEERAVYTYPAYGWYWFDTEAEARKFFGLPPAEPASTEEMPDAAE